MIMMIIIIIIIKVIQTKYPRCRIAKSIARLIRAPVMIKLRAGQFIHPYNSIIDYNQQDQTKDESSPRGQTAASGTA